MTQAAGSGPGETPGLEAGSPLALAEALATRLCHDLAGMLGSLMGALELATDEPGMTAEALPLASDAARQLGRRLRLLRVAWGGGAPDATSEPTIDMAALRELAAGLPGGRRVSVTWDDLHPDRVFTPQAARVLLNVVLLGNECLHGAGELDVAGGPHGDVMVTIDGPRAAWPCGFASMLAHPAAADAALRTSLAPRDLQAPITALLARRAGIGVSMLLGPGEDQAPPLLIALDR